MHDKVETLVQRAANSMSRCLTRYWPVNGWNEIGERNQTLHLATVLLSEDWHCWAEGHWKDATDRRLDLLAWHESTGTLLVIEAKRLHSIEQLRGIATDVARISGFEPRIEQPLAFTRRIGLLLATTWDPKITEWWRRGLSWPNADAVWNHRDPLLRDARAGTWGAALLGTQHFDGSTDRHHLLYAIWTPA